MDENHAPPPTPNEAALNAAAPLVDKMFLQVLGRVPEPDARQYWAELVAGGQTSVGEVAVGVFESDERLDPAIRRIYREYLRRAVDPDGLKHWRDDVWKRDGGPDAIISGILGSDEYFESAGGAIDAWLADIAQRLLGRPAEPAELQAWTQAIESGDRKRSQIVLEMLRSESNLRGLVQSWFRQYFVRAPSAEEENHYLERLRAGDSHRLVQIQMLDTQEWRDKPAGMSVSWLMPTGPSGEPMAPAPIRLPRSPAAPATPGVASPAIPDQPSGAGPTPMPPTPAPPKPAEPPPAARKPTPQSSYDLIFEQLGRDQDFD